jgi:hypothetical protein
MPAVETPKGPLMFSPSSLTFMMMAGASARVKE